MIISFHYSQKQTYTLIFLLLIKHSNNDIIYSTNVEITMKGKIRMKFKVDDITTNDYTSAFEIIKDKIRTKLHEINKAELLNHITEKKYKYQFLTDGITLTIQSTSKNELNNLEDNSIAATITFTFKNEKPLIYKIIKNPKQEK